MRTAITQSRKRGSFVGLRDLVRPQQLPSLAAWYDISDLSSLIYDGSNRVALVADKSGNSAVNVLCLNGVAGNYASAPDSVPLSITGDIDIRVQVGLSDWTPGTTQTLVSKYVTTGNQRTFILSVLAAGTLEWVWSADGATQTVKTSTAATSFTDDQTGWVRVTFDVDNGAGGNDLNFYTSTDGTTWTPLGATVTTAGTTSLFDGTGALGIGAVTGGASNMITGRIYRAQIYNGIAGTLVFDANFATAPKLATSFTESSANAATVTINTTGATGARISGARDLYQGTAANQPVYCFLPGTRMSTGRGLKKVEEITKEDTVYQENGRFDKLTNAWSHRYEGNIVKFSVAGATPLTVTDDHRVLILDGNDVRRWKNTKRIGLKRGTDKPYPFTPKTKWVLAKNVKQGDYVVMPKPELDEKVPMLSFPVVEGTRVNPIGGRTVPLTHELCELFGWWVAEGSFKRGDNRKIQGVVFNLSHDEMDVAKRLKKLHEDAGAGKAYISSYPHRGTTICTTSGTSFALFMEREFGSGAHNKKIPDWMLNAPNDLLRTFLKAYARGDGSFYKRWGNGCQSLHTVSERLANDLIMVCAKLGAPAKIIETKKPTGIVFCLRLNGHDIKRVFDGDTTMKGQRRWVEDDKNYYLLVNKTTVSHYTGEVYDFSSETETLGVPYIVHNCQWSGTNYGYLNGVAGNYFSTPDSAVVSVTGDIDIRANVVLASYPPSASCCISGKWLDPDQKSWFFTIDSLGRLSFATSANGSATALNYVSTATVTSAMTWLRVTLDVDNGSSQNVTTFYYSSDGVTWTPLETGKTVAGTTSLFDSTTTLLSGARGTGATENLSGRIYRAQIYNGIDGTLVFDFNPAAYSSGTTFPDSSANAATITLNGGSTIVTRTCLYFDGSNDYLKSPAFALAQPVSRYTVASQVSWTSGDYLWDGASAANGAALIQTTSTPQLNLNAGSSVAANTGLVLQTISVIAEVFNGAASFLTIARQAATTGNAGAGAPNGVTIGASGAATAANFGNITFSEQLIYSAAHGTNFSLRILMWLWRKWKPTFNI